MTSTPEPSAEEVELLRRARTGDNQAIETLYVLHVEPARRLASVLAGQSDGEELVADAFARVIAQLRAGRGPSLNFRAYLFTTIRNRFRDALRIGGRENPVSDQPWVLEENQAPAPAPDEPLDDAFGDAEAIAAFASLPDSWQEVLWHIEVEGRAVPEVAQLLRTTPQAVSSLAYRAREGLKLAYLNLRLASASEGATPRECRWTVDRLGRYVRGALSARAAAKVDGHLGSCPSCTTALADLADTNRKLAALFVPLVLVGGAPSFTASGAGSAGADAGSAGTAARTPKAGGAATRMTLGARRAVALVNGPAMVALVTTAALAAVGGVGWWALSSSDPAARRPISSSQQTTPAEPGRGPALEGWAADIRLPLADFEVPREERVVPVPHVRPIVEPGVVADAPPPQQPAPEVPTAPSDRRAPVDPQPVQPPSIKPPPPQPPPPPPPVQVTPVAPSATAIQSCGTYGSVVLPSTTGVSYALTLGDGRQGPWTVTAAAEPGHVIAAGAPTTFSGDLGSYYPCPFIASAGTTPVGPANEWDVTADIDATGQTPYLIVVDFKFDDVVYTRGDQGAGWECWATNGSSREPLPGSGEFQLMPDTDWITCEFSYTGTDPGPVTVPVGSPPGGAPAGSATARSGERVWDTKTF